MYSEPEACKRIASYMKMRVPWLDATHSNEDGQKGLVVTVYGDRTHVQEVLGLEECFITFGVIIRLDIAFEKGERPPSVRKLYCLSPHIMLVNPDRGNSWSGGDLGSVAQHLGMKEDDLHEIIAPGKKVFRSENLGTIAEEYVQYLLKVEENLAAIILSSYLTKEPT